MQGQQEQQEHLGLAQMLNAEVRHAPGLSSNKIQIYAVCEGFCSFCRQETLCRQVSTLFDGLHLEPFKSIGVVNILSEETGAILLQRPHDLRANQVITSVRRPGTDMGSALH